MRRYGIPKLQQPNIFLISKFAGLNNSVTETQIEPNESPDMLNMVLDEQGALDKRTGYKRIFTTSLGPGKINGMYFYQKKNGTTFFLFAHKTNLYKTDASNNPVLIYSNLADTKINFFTMNDYCFIQDGTSYLRFDGSNVVTAQSVAYIPTLYQAAPPTGGGTAYEQWNLLGNAFKVSFSADGTATVYSHDALKGIDATAISVVVNGSTMNEGSGFTVDRVNGKLTFSTAPAKGNADNLIVTAYRTHSDMPPRINKCTLAIAFGGSNDTRMFISGNPDSPNVMWRSSLYNPTYFPENDYIAVGGNDQSITGLVLHYDTCIIYRQRKNEFRGSIWQMSYEITDAGDITFPIKPINDTVGLIGSNTLAILDNNPVGLTRQGVFMLEGGTVRDERNVLHISANVEDPTFKVGLTDESHLEDACAIDYKGKYILSINNLAYVLDYRQSAWTKWDSIPASCFMESNGDLYFGSNIEGLVYRFSKQDESLPYRDDGQPIKAHWESRLLNFGSDVFTKDVEAIYVNVKSAPKTGGRVYYSTEDSQDVFVEDIRMDLIDYSMWDYAGVTYLATVVPRELITLIRERKIQYFKIRVESNGVDESLGILSISMQYGMRDLQK